MTRLILLLCVPACVIDNGVQGKDGASPGFDSGETIDSGDTEETAAVLEDCNGIDDNGDGRVDEGYGDLDGDGIADCVDDACTLTSTPAGTVPVADACAGSGTWTPPENLGDFVIEWTVTGPDVMSAPVVANLTDDDGDGDIDGEDIPDILAVDYSSGDLYNYSGDGSGLHWRMALGVNPMAILAADIDADGEVNIVYIGTGGLCALAPDTTKLWCNPAVGYTYNGGPTVTDLEGDGHAEIVAGNTIVSGETGATLATGLCMDGPTFPVVGDLDGDGVKEIVCGASAYAADGTQLWNQAGGSYNYAALVDVDADDAPEVLVTGWGYGIALFAGDGTPLGMTGTGGSYSAACVADFDGDGDPEFAVPSNRQIEVYEADLTPMWTQPSVDNSGASSCSAFDFNADGAYEILYADEETMYVFDGATGTVLFKWTDHTSGTMWEYPVVVDVDHDGSSEIIVGESYYGNTGLVIIGHASNGWPPTGPNWAQYAFDGGNVSDDGEVLRDPPPPWRDGGFIHARPPGALDPASGTWTLGEGAPDLGINVTDTCTADCTDGPVQVALSATNRGGVAADALVVLYAVDETGEREVARTTLTLPSGTRADPLIYTLGIETIGAFGWRATIERVDGGADCDEVDNTASWGEVECR